MFGFVLTVSDARRLVILGVPAAGRSTSVGLLFVVRGIVMVKSLLLLFLLLLLLLLVNDILLGVFTGEKEELYGMLSLSMSLPLSLPVRISRTCFTLE